MKIMQWNNITQLIFLEKYFWNWQLDTSNQLDTSGAAFDLCLMIITIKDYYGSYVIQGYHDRKLYVLHKSLWQFFS